MKPMTLAYVLVCLSVSGGAASALELQLGTGADVKLGTDSGLSLGLGAGVSTPPAGTRIVGQAATDGKQPVAPSTAKSNEGKSSEDQLAPVIELIASSKWKPDSFAHLDNVSGHAYALSTWLNAGNEAELKAALEANAGQIAELHAAISASASLTAWLKQQGIEPSQVVAVGTTTGGSLAVFTN